MGILNVTPDSFADGGRHYLGVGSALDRIATMVREGADIIDIGGESTRPGASEIPVDEELNRVLPVLEKALLKHKKTIFSIDTRKFEVARQALELGAHIINDVSGLQKEYRLAELCGQFDAGLVIMHSKGTPDVMQQNPVYDDVVEDIISFLKKQIGFAREKGVKKIVIDPGFGFGKTSDHNLEITARLEEFKQLGYPVLLGASRKSTIGKILGGRPASGRLAGTIALHYHALLKGADILRVHDVREARDAILIFNALKGAER